MIGDRNGPSRRCAQDWVSWFRWHGGDKMTYHSVPPLCVTVRNSCNLIESVDEWEFFPMVLGFAREMLAGGGG